MKQLRPSLDGQHFHVAIIGGGINGAAIARQCAQEGLRTLLVEQRDFGSGTTSRSTRIIHGGLRYLEHGELGLVRECLRERERLLTERPHLVRPLSFLLALDGAATPHSALEMRLGLWLYRRFAGRPGPVAQRSTVEHGLDSGRRWAVFQYDDAQCEFPERLVAEWLGEAMAAGAVARNYTEALEVDILCKRACGLRLRDRMNAAEYRITANWVINAAGPWADAVCRQSGIRSAAPMIGGVRGSHLVLPRFTGAPRSAIYTAAHDGRPIFVVPWNEQLLVGTTEIPDNDDPGRTQPSAEEISYLLDAVNRLFPRAGIGLGEVRCAFAGVRPLPFAPGKEPAAITRRHLLHDHAEEGAAGMISVIGGKLTTAASLARECTRRIGVRVSDPGPTLVANAPADGIETTLQLWAEQVAGMAKIPAASARAIAAWHGRRALCVARLAGSDPLLRQPLCEHTSHVVAEALEAMENERAMTLGDILLRRVPVALGACWSQECSQRAAQVIGAALGWEDRERGAQLEAFLEECAQFLCKPAAETLATSPKRAA